MLEINNKICDKLTDEEDLLSKIALITSRENALEYKSEFHSTKHAYNFETYIEILERVYHLLLRGITNTAQVIVIIRNGLDGII